MDSRSDLTAPSDIATLSSCYNCNYRDLWMVSYHTNSQTWNSISLSNLSNLSLKSLSLSPSACLSVCLSRCVQAGVAWLEVFEVIPLLLLLSWSCKSLSFCLPLCEESPCNCWSWVPGRQVSLGRKNKDRRVVTGQWDWSLGLSLPAFTLLSVLLFLPYFTCHLSHRVCAFVFPSLFVRPSAWPHVRIHPTELSEPTKDATYGSGRA